MTIFIHTGRVKDAYHDEISEWEIDYEPVDPAGEDDDSIPINLENDNA